MGRLVDFHCHLDLFPDHVAAVDSCERDRMFTLAVTTTPRAWPRNRDLTAKKHYVRAALGLHPQLVKEHAQELSLWESYLSEARYIGEVGLDAGPQYIHSLPQQKKLFQRVLQCCAETGGKILTVHSVRAASLVLDMIEKYLPSQRGKVVLHWFTGSRAEAHRAIKLGCLFSVNINMLRNDRHRKLLVELPLESFLTETDAPFTQKESSISHSNDVAITIEELANLRKLEIMTIRHQIEANLRTLVSTSKLNDDARQYL